MKLKDVLEKTTQFFKEKGFSSPRLDAEILLSHGLGVERLRLYLDFDRPLSEKELAPCRELVRRRSQGEPVAYLTGYKDFYQSRFFVTPDVLIPRPETESLVEEAIEWIQRRELEAPRIVDLGTGSGCIGLSVLQAFPGARLLAMDVSAGALSVARKNAEQLGLLDRVAFVEGDAGNPEMIAKAMQTADFNKVDALLANPPYIAKDDERVEAAVRKFEPNQALFSEEQGLQALRAWSLAWETYLSETSLVLMEMGLDQGPAMTQHFENLGLQNVKVIKDLAGHDRLIKGEING